MDSDAKASESLRLLVPVAVQPRTTAPSGYSLLELMIVVCLVSILGAMAVPPLLATVDDFRVAGAARYMATRLQDTRMEAAARSADVALRFTQTAGRYGYAVYVDGNRNGVRTRDIEQGTDRQIQPLERLLDQFSGADFGTIPGLPSIDPGSPPPGLDPIKLGSSNILTFSALGTSSSGSLYIRGRRSAQYAVRVLGATGRTRVLKFDRRAGRWKPI